jgi:hypothetical protein
MYYLNLFSRPGEGVYLLLRHTLLRVISYNLVGFLPCFGMTVCDDAEEDDQFSISTMILRHIALVLMTFYTGGSHIFVI